MEIQHEIPTIIITTPKTPDKKLIQLQKRGSASVTASASMQDDNQAQRDPRWGSGPRWWVCRCAEQRFQHQHSENLQILQKKIVKFCKSRFYHKPLGFFFFGHKVAIKFTSSCFKKLWYCEAQSFPTKNYNIKLKSHGSVKIEILQQRDKKWWCQRGGIWLNLWFLRKMSKKKSWFYNKTLQSWKCRHFMTKCCFLSKKKSCFFFLFILISLSLIS